jgi:hypothetical protein
MNENVSLSEGAAVGFNAKNGLTESIKLARAAATIVHRRPTRFLADGSADPSSYVQIGEAETVYNVIPTVGRDYLHLQGYGTTGLGTNGFNWIALSNDTLTETTASTTLSTEIVANGLTRAQGAYAHTTAANTTTIDKTFTASGAQSCQKAALFTASSAGIMNHALSFTQRALITSDTIQITFTITLG